MENQNDQPEVSKVMRCILSASKVKEEDFLQEIWQQKPCLFPFPKGMHVDSSVIASGNGFWNDDKMQDSPWEEVVRNGWYVLKDLLQHAQDEQEEEIAPTSAPTTATTTAQENPAPAVEQQYFDKKERAPLVFHNQELQLPDKVQSMYGTSLFAPYLNGCSIVLNHADAHSPWIAALCNDIQRMFPHAYANCYLTPPNCQAVPAHADDRDVLILQVVGSKKWQVYQTVPIPYPYPHQQVGKDGIPIPSNVLEGSVEIDTTLCPGDVLYMPRGYVHQASCQMDPSFHITIALATHDWTLAGLFSSATEQTLTRILDFRRSIVPTHGPTVNILEEQIDSAFTMLRREITADAILKRLSAKLETHNRRAFSIRMKQIHDARFPPSVGATALPDDADVVGLKAARIVTYTTTLRCATSNEKARTATSSSNQPRGLHVREENADAIMKIVTAFKADSSLACRVVDLKTLLSPNETQRLICDLTLLCLAKRCVELGALAIVTVTEMLVV